MPHALCSIPHTLYLTAHTPCLAQVRDHMVAIDGLLVCAACHWSYSELGTPTLHVRPRARARSRARVRPRARSRAMIRPRVRVVLELVRYRDPQPTRGTRGWRCG